ncbi:M20/M25/M40 family metallo-hydrolase [Novosphingobium taihuense]|uniref:Acetylornithine deacetylase/succinyl-diaminopimelate desuccinylase-like protein n=1 Tax=Novosphingobium taihuense TaxID=260085 RepID=A0A7W7ADT1_9SPHN|nr:M20/M25/M40 family metallo-hydrolase [Novosphingobium taihuense]MBB4614474.1 acetylornithine deacetylase/succinyl-diaminopimelate desuccinylase-like protein [Novosphingobium taihuense]TWH86283.1 acetylornithine deacetylase/succinyl-diaminopimelate desuccinylase-like protein [Novosphingobium taihuense]
MRKIFALGVATSLLSAPASAAESPLRPDQLAYRDLLKEMVETDTSITTGSCTALADKIEGHLRKAGFTDAEIHRFAVPEAPKEGGIVAILPGTSKTAKPILLLGHLDVVVAKREDWTRDPYTFIEEGGYFYGRGVADMKAMDAIWVDMFMNLRKAGQKPKRTLKLALTCGEETSTAFNGVKWLTENRKDLIAAEFALNEGGSGRTDKRLDQGGKVVVQTIHVGEKTPVNYRIEATNPGGHSSAPVRDNAIYELADALVRIRNFEFPLMLNDTTRAFFSKAGAARADDMGKAMVTIAANPDDKAAEALLNTDRSFHSMLRTTCVATLLDGGHANNALPQRAGSNINCRIFPGVSAEAVRKTLEEVIADPRMTVARTDNRGPDAVAPPLDPKILGPAEKLVAKYYPGVPMVPMMSTGATDGVFLGAIGIPSYGPPGLFGDPDGNGTHGLNERLAVRSAMTGRDLLNELVRTYAF